MLTGKLWLDYDDGDEGEHWDANVTRAFLRDREIVVEFSGNDLDYGPFSGTCKLNQDGAVYLGDGTFTVGGEHAVAAVSVASATEGEATTLSGTWQDAGDSEPYELTIELIGKQ